MGDFNTHLGADDATYTFHSSTNSNGKLMIGNTSFRKKKGKLWKYISDMKRLMSQVNYILINQKWKNSTKNCEAYSSLSSIGSNHRIVSTKMKISFRVKKAWSSTTRLEHTSELIHSGTIQHQQSQQILRIKHRRYH